VTPDETRGLAEWWPARLRGLSDEALAVLQKVFRTFSSQAAGATDEEKHRLVLRVQSQLKTLDPKIRAEVQTVLLALAEKLLAEAQRQRAEAVAARLPGGKAAS